VISIQALFKPATADEWFAKLLSIGDKVGIKATSWQPGAVVRSVVRIMSYAFAAGDAVISGIAQGGFLDFAGSGSVDYTDASGVTERTPVTVEGGPGWLDVLTEGRYATERIELEAGGGAQAFTNTSASTYGSIAAGTLHVSSPFTKVQYSTTTAVTIPPSPVLGTSVSLISNYFGQIKVTTATAHGRSTDDVVTVIGALGVPELAGQWSGRVTVIDANNLALQGTLFSGAWVSGGELRAPTVATVGADTKGSNTSSIDASGNPKTNTVTQLVTTLLGVTTANVDVFYGTDTESNAALVARSRLQLQSKSTGGPRGAYEYYALSAGEWAAKLTPPLRLGAAITRVRLVTDPGDGTNYCFVANPVGASSSADVAVVDAVFQAFATPNAVTSKAIAATNRNISCAVTVWLKAAFATDATRALFQRAIQDYFQTLPIGGIDDPQGSYRTIVPLEGIAGAIFDIAEDNGFKPQNVAVLLDGNPLDVQLIVNALTLVAEVAILSPTVPTVTLVPL
jgi:hypothetical protein